MNFEYPEDEMFFAQLLTAGDVVRLREEYADIFDFRDPAVKRAEFDAIAPGVREGLLEKYGEVCQLQLHPECSKEKMWQVDHMVPLSTNELNKKLRHAKAVKGKKVIAQSFGSNHPRNLVLACKRCNAFKKHRLMMRGKS